MGGLDGDRIASAAGKPPSLASGFLPLLSTGMACPLHTDIPALLLRFPRPPRQHQGRLRSTGERGSSGIRLSGRVTASDVRTRPPGGAAGGRRAAQAAGGMDAPAAVQIAIPALLLRFPRPPRQHQGRPRSRFHAAWVPHHASPPARAGRTDPRVDASAGHRPRCSRTAASMPTARPFLTSCRRGRGRPRPGGERDRSGRRPRTPPSVRLPGNSGRRTAPGRSRSRRGRPSPCRATP
jgi:hypothetical protein